MKTFWMTALAAMSLLGATAAQAQEATVTVNEPPARERAETRTVYGVPLTVAGGGLLVASYVPSMIVAAASPNESDRMLWAPVSGLGLTSPIAAGAHPTAVAIPKRDTRHS